MISCPSFSFRRLQTTALALGLALATHAPARAEPASAGASGWDLGELLDHLPDFRNLGLPGIKPGGPLTIYARPHLGDILRRDYLRLPVGARLHVRERTEFNAEVESYFTHGLSDAAGYGLSRLRLGAKHENEFKRWPGTAWSWGLDFTTPLSRPPMELTDGHRHTIPYVSVSRALVPKWKLVGYTGIGADILARTDLPCHFGRNELHANSLTVGAGVTRSWSRFRAALTLTGATTSLMSDEGRQLVALRPDVMIPLTRLDGQHTRLTLTLSGRAVAGPDGREIGVSSGLRVEFGVVTGKTKRSSPEGSTFAGTRE